MKFDVLDRLKSDLDYDPETGFFTYKVRAARRVMVGDIAGSVNDEGYRHIRLGGKAFKAHRLAWLYVFGVWPDKMIDHINGSKDDNRISNLREATRSENLGNSKTYRKGRSHPKGVFKHSEDRWSARIQRNKTPVFLGYFPTMEMAHDAYQQAATDQFGQFARAK